MSACTPRSSGWPSLIRSCLLVGLLAAVVGVSAGGCSRTRYRQRADADAYCLIEEKNNDPRWALENYVIDVAPSSRMFNPDSPDFPPMPPDDPTAHKLMHCVDGKRGYPRWHAHGDVPYVENPEWLNALPWDEQGRIRVDADTAVQLALLHSSTYQRQLEELYLSALDVAFERFRFDTQFFGGFSTYYTADGRNRPGGGGESRSALALSSFPTGTDLRARRLFGAGGEFFVGMANSIIWQFSGPDTQVATTLLDFTFVQPLLRFGGRDRVMERLTISERALLANVRQMERYRQGFYVEVVTGRFSPQGPSRRGGVFGGSGLEGFSGIGGGGFGRVGNFGGGFFGNNFGLIGGAGAGQAGGYLGLLQSYQAIRNQRATIASLRSSVSQLEAFFRAGRIDYFQVELARQALFNAQSQLLNAEQVFQTSLDQFKRTLGFPPYLELVLDSQLISPFELIDTQLVELQNRITDLQEKTGKAIVELLESSRAEPTTEDLPDPRASAARATADSAFEPSQTASRTSDSAGRRPGLIPKVVLAAAIADAPDVVWTSQLKSELEQLQTRLREAESIRRQAQQISQSLVRSDIRRLRDAIDGRVKNLTRLRQVVYPRLREVLSSGIENADDDVNSSQVDAPDASAPSTNGSKAKKAGDGVLRDLAVAQSSFEDDSSIVPINADELRKLPAQLEETLRDIERAFNHSEQQGRSILSNLREILEQGPTLTSSELTNRLRDRVLLPIPNHLNELAANVLSLSLVQARARTESISLQPIDMTWQSALATARENRLDWMNARASLVDAWRLIQFNADTLQSRLDIVVSGDVGNIGDNPFRLRSSTGRLRLGFQFEAPITRLAERNQFRQAQIEYQQARRAYYEFEDQVAAELRSTLRSLDVNQLNFEYRRVAVQVAIAQVELARLRLQEPPRPEVEFQFGATTARDLVNALSDLLVVQNDFLSVWTNQEVFRRVLDLDMGTMQLDRNGLWIDPGPIVDGPSPAGLDIGPDVEKLPPTTPKRIGKEGGEPTPALTLAPRRGERSHPGGRDPRPSQTGPVSFTDIEVRQPNGLANVPMVLEDEVSFERLPQTSEMRHSIPRKIAPSN